MVDSKNESLLFYSDEESALNGAYGSTTTFLGEWLILLLTCSIAVFVLPLTPSFTLNSTSLSLLNVTHHNCFTTDLAVSFLVQDSNPIGITTRYRSCHVSLSHHHQTLSNLSLPGSFLATFRNVSLTVDQWGVGPAAAQAHGTNSCGLAHADLRFAVDATYTQPLLPRVRDTLLGRCGEVTFELCSSGAGSTVTHSILKPCEVYSEVMHKVRVVFVVVLGFLLVTAAVVPFVVTQFFCSQS